jgi:protein-S-isoprenylcysteine O-methyltransferase Ste14
MLTNLPVYLPRALLDFFTPFCILEKVFIILGFIVFFYSMTYLRIRKMEGLVTTGPYSLVRHPQYLGIILLSLGLTSWSIWILKNTFGIGFLSPSQTIIVWFFELSSYIVLAYIEEIYLLRKYGESLQKYKSIVPFLIPFLNSNREYLNIIVSLIIPTILMFYILTIQ